MTASIGSPALWIGFFAIIIAMLALDLGVFNKREHEASTKESLIWTIVWISLSLLFNLAIYRWYGPQRGMEFFAGYLIEKALSVDNIFVFILVFAHFQVPKHFQHRVLFWGILGALVMRGIFIGAGAALISSFHGILYVFGAILVFTAAKMLFSKDEDNDPEKNPMFKAFKKCVPCVCDYRGTKFIVKENGKRFATPLLLVLVAIEASDLVFAIDSIPAVFAITQDPFIVYTSNIFAILGLRALYFLLAGAMLKIRFLKFGLSLILGFIGVKMLVVDFVKISIGYSLSTIAGILAFSIILSLVFPERVSAAEATE